MSNLIKHAKKELDLIYNEEALKEPYNKSVYDCIMKLVKVFAKQGHSNFSAGYVREAFNKLANYETLLPLTGEDNEWTEITNSPDLKYQNKRNSAVFKDSDEKAYFIDAVVWKDKSGGYTNRESRMYVKFPCMPKTFYVDRYEDGSYNEEQYKKALEYYE